MTQVLVTATGDTYHAFLRCPALAEEAQELGHPVDPVDQPLKGLRQTACPECWPTISGFDDWRDLEMEVERLGDSPYEALFVKNVLRDVADLDPAEVLPKRDVEVAPGVTQHVDFVLPSPVGHRVAVQVDHPEAEGLQAALEDAGWGYVSLTKEQVTEQSALCVAQINAALRDPKAPRPTEQARAGGAPAPKAPQAAQGPAAPAEAPAPKSGLGLVILGALALLTIIVLVLVLL